MRLYTALFIRTERTFIRTVRTFYFHIAGGAEKDKELFTEFRSFFRISCLIVPENSNKFCKSHRKNQAHTVAHHLTLDKSAKKLYSSQAV